MTIFDEPLIMVTKSNYGVHYVCHVHQYCNLEWMPMHWLDLILDLESIFFYKANVW